jgi:hypothetical protein
VAAVVAPKAAGVASRYFLGPMAEEPMIPLDRIKAIQARFIAGSIPVGELLLHLEPALNLAASDKSRDAKVRKIVNRIEVVINTENEPRRSRLVLEQIEEALAFAHE